MAWSTEDSFAYSFHIGIFQSQRRLGTNRATIEIKKESQIGDESRSGRSERFLAPEVFGGRLQKLTKSKALGAIFHPALCLKPRMRRATLLSRV